MFIDIQAKQCYSNSTPYHVYIKPHPQLRTWIAHYTYLQESASAYENPFLTLVPDAAGCITMQDIGNGLECMFWGATTRCVQVPSKQESMRFHFFIEFHPTAAYALLHHTQQVYLNKQVPLQDIHKELFYTIQQAYDSCSTLSAFIVVLDKQLLKMVEEATSCVRFVRHQIAQGNSMDMIMNQTGYSRRHLQRMFLEQMGCSMKAYQRVERINQAVQFLQQGMDGTQAAHLCGYYDQSHFIHDFVQVCEQTPKSYIQNLSDFYNEPIKF